MILVRSQKSEARIQKKGLFRGTRVFWLLTIVSWPFWLLASIHRLPVTSLSLIFSNCLFTLPSYTVLPI